MIKGVKMDNERDYRAEYEALLKQYEEEKRQEQEEPYDFAAEYEKEKIEKHNELVSNVVLILFFALIGFSLLGKFLFEPLTLFGIVFIFIGFIISAISFKKEPIFAVTSLILFIVSAIATFCGNPMMLFAVIPGTIALSLLSSTITNSIPLIRLLRKIKPLKKSCTEKATAICINPNERNRHDLIKENIEVIPRRILLVRRRGSGLNSKTSYYTRIIAMLFCPIYELDYYGTKYTLCDNYYGITGTEEGESREILINPENPQEFYDEKRYKSDVRQILKTIPLIAAILMMAIFIGVAVFISNYDILLG